MQDRRQFLKNAVLATSYTVIVNASHGLAPEPLLEEVAPRIDALAPDDLARGTIPDEPNMFRLELECDVLIAGGGLAGVCAALSAGRNGAKVILLQDRSRLGGNASSEVRMHPMGSKFGFRETGIIEELSIENAVQNEHHSWELWDLLLYDYCIRESNIRLLLDTTLYRAEMESGLIRSIWARCDRTEHLYHIKAHVFMDCTGDSRLALEAGAEYMQGREAPEVFNETNATYDKPGTTQGSSILFTSRKHDRPMAYQAPSWARSISAEDLKFRNVGPHNWEYGYWWIELGGVYDTIRDNERLRFELLAIVLGVWDYIKNSGRFPESENWALETVGMIPGKRDSRRVTGETIMTQADIEGKWKEFPDAIAFGGWPMDDHPALGFDAPDVKPYRPAKYEEAYNIPYGSLYSKSIRNLMMAGRNISASHVAFSSTRVMKTCAVIGQAAGTAAAMCAAERLLPSDLRADRKRTQALQQRLLRDDQLILGARNEDPDDHIRKSKVATSVSIQDTRPENLLTGQTWDAKGQVDNRWIGQATDEPAWVQFDWDSPRKISTIQIVHDTGLFRTLTMTASASVQRTMHIGPQPETIRNYDVMGVLPDGTTKKLAEVRGNYQRLRRHNFDPVSLKALRIHIPPTSTGEARLYEVRAYT